MKNSRSAEWVRWGTLLALGLTGCNRAAPVREAPKAQALCFAERPARMHALAPEQWRAEPLFQLLLSGYDARTGQAATPHTDCMGTPVLWEDPAPGECVEASAASTPLPVRPLTPADLVVSEVRPDLQLVWAVVRHFSDGDGMGPVALVESTPRGLAVRALGVLRSRTRNAKLRLERVGGADLLVAEGERCSGPNAASCQRSVRMVFQRGNRFINESVLNAQGACASPGVFQLNRTASRTLPSRWLRRYDYTAALSFGTDGIRVQEQMFVNDLDPRQPTMPARQFRKAQIERRVQVSSGRLVVDDTSLWGRLLEEGATESGP
ncbi:hypothetical protein D7Y27_15855 [Corallococcus sp. AB004]|uniref:hypothetical protein n=1 Tax=Corallococcus exiguus TaxID=83462 RepID=UPI000EA0D49B|nr:hypothetical protein [Corallococcus exiguus]NPC71210.1 hypothetical protein [Corallococcus exiguus]RKI43077.1 hypothetical protein D7Y27_15855 [Corallococcus sp. AB004]